MYATRAALTHMIAAGHGHIVNVSSMAGLQGAAYLAPYVASKWAVIGITRTAAMEWVGVLCGGCVEVEVV